MKNRIYNNLNNNILFKAKYTKFYLKEYIDKNISNENIDNNNFDDDNSINKFNDKNKNKNNNMIWLKNNLNSCRYDSFLDLF